MFYFDKNTDKTNIVEFFIYVQSIHTQLATRMHAAVSS